jgi:hypothetical protein
VDEYPTLGLVSVGSKMQSASVPTTSNLEKASTCTMMPPIDHLWTTAIQRGICLGEYILT